MLALGLALALGVALALGLELGCLLPLAWRIAPHPQWTLPCRPRCRLLVRRPQPLPRYC